MSMLRRAIENYVEDPLAEELLRGEFAGQNLIGFPSTTPSGRSYPIPTYVWSGTNANGNSFKPLEITSPSLKTGAASARLLRQSGRSSAPSPC